MKLNPNIIFAIIFYNSNNMSSITDNITPLRIESAQSNVAFSLKNPPCPSASLEGALGGLNEKRCINGANCGVETIWRITEEDRRLYGNRILECMPSSNGSEMPVLRRGQSLISLNDETSVLPVKIPIKKTNVEVVTNDLYRQLLEALLHDPECDDDETYEYVEKKGNIILDMDGTLGDNIPETFMENPSIYPFCYTKPIPRPGLRRFLRFVFAHYERVSIWTAALPSWYNEFKNEVLLPNMPPGAEFHFERTRVPGAVYVPLKPLSEIYAKYPAEYNESNTTVVDDNENTFKANVDNAVHIKAFFYDKFGTTPEERKINAASDRGLFDTIDILKSRIYGIPAKLVEDENKENREPIEDGDEDDLYN